jgi:uncharacterized protein (DUF952 family)
MGFHIEINSILRSSESYNLEVGKTYSFSKEGSRLFWDNLPVWLTDRDWTARAEIKIMSQTRKDDVLSGEFRVEHIYTGQEQKTITDMFIRMYGGYSDPYIYILSDEAEYNAALKAKALTRDSIELEGFIHASPKSQLNRVANKYYKQKANPMILVIDKDKVTSPLKWEPATGGTYPHIYGPLNTDAIVKTMAIDLNENGEFDL